MNNDTPTTPHAPVTTEERVNRFANLLYACGWDSSCDAQHTKLLAVVLGIEEAQKQAVEQMRLNGCEAVRRSEEAAKVSAAIADTTIQELTQNMEALSAKLAADTARADIAERALADAHSVMRSNNTEREALAARVAHFKSGLAWTKANEHLEQLEKQVVVLRKALEGPCMESAKWAFSNSLGSQGIMFELAQKAIAAINAALTATPASASAEIVKCGGAELTSLPVAELMAAREDTARLDWLEAKSAGLNTCSHANRGPHVWRDDPTEDHPANMVHSYGHTYRAAIDAARQSTT